MRPTETRAMTLNASFGAQTRLKHARHSRDTAAPGATDSVLH
jgi:hypothetical protein